MEKCMDTTRTTRVLEPEGEEKRWNQHLNQRDRVF